MREVAKFPGHTVEAPLLLPNQKHPSRDRHLGVMQHGGISKRVLDIVECLLSYVVPCNRLRLDLGRGQ